MSEWAKARTDFINQMSEYTIMSLVLRGKAIQDFKLKFWKVSN